MRRRTFIFSAVAAWLLLSGTPLRTHAGTAGHKRASHQRLKRLVERYFKDTQSACAVGLRYQSLHPDLAADAVQRVRDLLDMPHYEGKCLNRTRTADFASGHTVVIDGWVLARCEADLCAALATLSNT